MSLTSVVRRWPKNVDAALRVCQDIYVKAMVVPCSGAYGVELPPVNSEGDSSASIRFPRQRFVCLAILIEMMGHRVPIYFKMECAKLQLLRGDLHNAA
jgi:hypothetical protein